jgi:hypothetical protein
MRILLHLVVERLRVRSCRWLRIAKTAPVVKPETAARNVQCLGNVAAFSLDFSNRPVQ